MAVVINGSGTVTGISVGGLPDGIVDAGTLATNSVDSAELIDGAVDASHLAGLTYADMPAGTIIQVVSASHSGSAISTSSDSNVTTGLSLTITPKYANSHIWLTLNGGTQDYGTDNLNGVTSFYRNKDGAGWNSLGYVDALHGNDGSEYSPHSGQLFDTTHNSTASIEYAVYMRSRSSVGTYYFHQHTGGISGKIEFTAMEVKQ